MIYKSFQRVKQLNFDLACFDLGEQEIIIMWIVECTENAEEHKSIDV